MISPRKKRLLRLNDFGRVSGVGVQPLHSPIPYTMLAPSSDVTATGAFVSSVPSHSLPSAFEDSYQMTASRALMRSDLPPATDVIEETVELCRTRFHHRPASRMSHVLERKQRHAQLGRLAQRPQQRIGHVAGHVFARRDGSSSCQDFSKRVGAAGGGETEGQ